MIKKFSDSIHYEILEIKKIFEDLCASVEQNKTGRIISLAKKRKLLQETAIKGKDTFLFAAMLYYDIKFIEFAYSKNQIEKIAVYYQLNNQEALDLSRLLQFGYGSFLVPFFYNNAKVGKFLKEINKLEDNLDFRKEVYQHLEEHGLKCDLISQEKDSVFSAENLIKKLKIYSEQDLTPKNGFLAILYENIIVYVVEQCVIQNRAEDIANILFTQIKNSVKISKKEGFEILDKFFNLFSVNVKDKNALLKSEDYEEYLCWVLIYQSKFLTCIAIENGISSEILGQLRDDVNKLIVKKFKDQRKATSAQKCQDVKKTDFFDFFYEDKNHLLNKKTSIQDVFSKMIDALKKDTAPKYVFELMSLNRAIQSNLTQILIKSHTSEKNKNELSSLIVSFLKQLKILINVCKNKSEDGINGLAEVFSLIPEQTVKLTTLLQGQKYGFLVLFLLEEALQLKTLANNASVPFEIYVKFITDVHNILNSGELGEEYKLMSIDDLITEMSFIVKAQKNENIDEFSEKIKKNLIAHCAGEIVDHAYTTQDVTKFVIAVKSIVKLIKTSIKLNANLLEVIVGFEFNPKDIKSVFSALMDNKENEKALYKALVDNILSHFKDDELIEESLSFGADETLWKKSVICNKYYAKVNKFREKVYKEFELENDFSNLTQLRYFEQWSNDYFINLDNEVFDYFNLSVSSVIKKQNVVEKQLSDERKECKDTRIQNKTVEDKEVGIEANKNEEKIEKFLKLTYLETDKLRTDRRKLLDNASIKADIKLFVKVLEQDLFLLNYAFDNNEFAKISLLLGIEYEDLQILYMLHTKGMKKQLQWHFINYQNFENSLIFSIYEEKVNGDRDKKNINVEQLKLGAIKHFAKDFGDYLLPSDFDKKVLRNFYNFLNNGNIINSLEATREILSLGWHQLLMFEEKGRDLLNLLSRQIVLSIKFVADVVKKGKRLTLLPFFSLTHIGMEGVLELIKDKKYDVLAWYIINDDMIKKYVQCNDISLDKANTIKNTLYSQAKIHISKLFPNEQVQTFNEKLDSVDDLLDFASCDNITREKKSEFEKIKEEALLASKNLNLGKLTSIHYEIKKLIMDYLQNHQAEPFAQLLIESIDLAKKVNETGNFIHMAMIFCIKSEMVPSFLHALKEGKYGLLLQLLMDTLEISSYSYIYNLTNEQFNSVVKETAGLISKKLNFSLQKPGIEFFNEAKMAISKTQFNKVENKEVENELISREETLLKVDKTLLNDATNHQLHMISLELDCYLANALLFEDAKMFADLTLNISEFVFYAYKTNNSASIMHVLKLNVDDTAEVFQYCEANHIDAFKRWFINKYLNHYSDYLFKKNIRKNFSNEEKNKFKEDIYKELGVEPLETLFVYAQKEVSKEDCQMIISSLRRLANENVVNLDKYEILLTYMAKSPKFREELISYEYLPKKTDSDNYREIYKLLDALWLCHIGGHIFSAPNTRINFNKFLFEWPGSYKGSMVSHVKKMNLNSEFVEKNNFEEQNIKVLQNIYKKFFYREKNCQNFLKKIKENKDDAKCFESYDVKKEKENMLKLLKKQCSTVSNKQVSPENDLKKKEVSKNVNTFIFKRKKPKEDFKNKERSLIIIDEMKDSFCKLRSLELYNAIQDDFENGIFDKFDEQKILKKLSEKKLIAIPVVLTSPSWNENHTNSVVFYDKYVFFADLGGDAQNPGYHLYTCDDPTEIKDIAQELINSCEDPMYLDKFNNIKNNLKKKLVLEIPALPQFVGNCGMVSCAQPIDFAIKFFNIFAKAKAILNEKNVNRALFVAKETAFLLHNKFFEHLRLDIVSKIIYAFKSSQCIINPPKELLSQMYILAKGKFNQKEICELIDSSNLLDDYDLKLARKYFHLFAFDFVSMIFGANYNEDLVSENRPIKVNSQLILKDIVSKLAKIFAKAYIETDDYSILMNILSKISAFARLGYNLASKKYLAEEVIPWPIGPSKGVTCTLYPHLNIEQNLNELFLLDNIFKKALKRGFPLIDRFAWRSIDNNHLEPIYRLANDTSYDKLICYALKNLRKTSSDKSSRDILQSVCSKYKNEIVIEKLLVDQNDYDVVLDLLRKQLPNIGKNINMRKVDDNCERDILKLDLLQKRINLKSEVVKFLKKYLYSDANIANKLRKDFNECKSNLQNKITIK